MWPGGKKSKGEADMLGIIGHLMGTVVRAFFRIVLAAIICAAIGVGVALLLVHAYVTPWQWPPSTLTTIALVAVGLLSAFVGGAIVLMIEAVRALMGAAGTAISDVAAPIKAVEHDLGKL
jgi:hypothetical protein